MEALLIVHAAVSWALVGLIWTVQLVIYPQFEKVGGEEFGNYHAAHMRRITWVVAPLMLVELGSAAWLLFGSVGGDPLFLASLVFLAINWISTALIQVPLHRRLEEGGIDLATCGKLTSGNWIRTLAWTVRGVLVAVLIL